MTAPGGFEAPQRGALFYATVYGVLFTAIHVALRHLITYSKEDRLQVYRYMTVVL